MNRSMMPGLHYLRPPRFSLAAQRSPTSQPPMKSPKSLTAVLVAIACSSAVACTDGNQGDSSVNSQAAATPGPEGNAEQSREELLSCDYKDGNVPHVMHYKIDLSSSEIDGIPADGKPHVDERGWTIVATMDDFSYQLLIDIPTNEDGDHVKETRMIERKNGRYEVDFQNLTQKLSYAEYGVCSNAPNKL
jgi:hypothetical protein